MSPDSLLVPGGGLVAPNQLSSDAEARVFAAAEQFQVGGVDLVVFSGGASWTQGDQEVPESELMATLAVKTFGIPAGRVEVETASVNTVSNLVMSAELLDGAENIGIVTQAYHMHRCLMLAKKIFEVPVVGVKAELARPPANWPQELVSLGIARSILRGTEKGDLETILRRNESIVAFMSALKKAPQNFRQKLFPG